MERGILSINKISIEDLSMLQLSYFFFPTGMYTMSNGLETLFYSKKIKMANELRDLIKVYIEHQIGPADCNALGNAYECADKLDLSKLIKVDQIIYSMKLVSEIRDASTLLVEFIMKMLDLLYKGRHIIK